MTKPPKHPLKRRKYVRSAIFAGGLICAALGIGVMGYHYLDDLPWIDALVDASMILGGMGPVNPLKNDGAKLFASIYALFSGLIFLASTAVIVAPWIHWLLHRLHADDEPKARGP